VRRCAHGFCHCRSRCGADVAPAFVEVGPPTDDDLQALLRTVIDRLMKRLTRRPVVEKILSHLGLDPQPPPESRAREVEQDFAT
jgi:hypothetical protein